MIATKTCSKCGEEYPATSDYFRRHKDGKDGLKNICKECCRLEARRYRERQGSALRERERERMRRWRKENPEKYREINREYYQLNREKILEQGLIRCRENPEKTREIQRKSSRRYKERHKDKLREYQLRPDVKLHQAISAGIWKSLDGRKNGRAWESLVGYTLEELMIHLESQFTKGMTWDNYGKWHIDHIKPKSCFNIESHRDPDFLECWSFWNLRPLWKRDNIVRGNRVEEVPLPLLPPSPE